METASADCFWCPSRAWLNRLLDCPQSPAKAPDASLLPVEPLPQDCHHRPEFHLLVAVKVRPAPVRREYLHFSVVEATARRILRELLVGVKPQRWIGMRIVAGMVWVWVFVQLSVVEMGLRIHRTIGHCGGVSKRVNPTAVKAGK